MTTLSAILDAYEAAEYHLFTGHKQLVFFIGKTQPELDALLHCNGVSSAAFITAYNPQSQRLDDHDNQAAQAQLQAILIAQNLTYLTGAGIDPKGIWPPEPSFMIFGLTLEAASSLARQFQQLAFVWIEAGQAPQLIFL